MTEKEMKVEITQAHIDGYNRGYAKAKDKIADIKANCDLAIEGRDVKIKELEEDKDYAEKQLVEQIQATLNLKKENAELKDALKGKKCNCMTYLNFKDLEKELIKAKEILGNLFEIIKRPYQFTAPRKIRMVNEAEQFLQENTTYERIQKAKYNYTD